MRGAGVGVAAVMALTGGLVPTVAVADESWPVMVRVLDRVNEHRARHGVEPLTIDRELTDHARGRAASCPNSTLPATGAGENLAYGTASDPRRFVDLWYGTNKHYDYETGGYSSPQALTFTQLVWRSSTRIGVGYSTDCARRHPEGYANVLVVGFAPAGNITDEFTANVPRPLGD